MSSLLALTAWAMAGIFAYKKKNPSLQLDDSVIKPTFTNAVVKAEGGTGVIPGCMCHVNTGGNSYQYEGAGIRFANPSDGPDSMSYFYNIQVPEYYYQVCDCSNINSSTSFTGTCSNMGNTFNDIVSVYSQNLDGYAAYCPMGTGWTPNY